MNQDWGAHANGKYQRAQLEALSEERPIFFTVLHKVSSQ